MSAGSERPPPEFVATRGELAQALDVSLQSIQTYHAEGAPRKTAQGYDVVAWKEWRRVNKRGRNQHVDEPETEPEDSARLLKAKADREEHAAAKAKLELEALRGRYVERSEMERRDKVRIRYVRDTLFSLARSLARQCSSRSASEIEQILKKEWRKVCDGFAEA